MIAAFGAACASKREIAGSRSASSAIGNNVSYFEQQVKRIGAREGSK
jgi:hypothetical protein